MGLFRKLNKKKEIEPKIYTGVKISYSLPIDSYIKHALNQMEGYSYNDVEVTLNKEGLFITIFVDLVKKGE